MMEKDIFDELGESWPSPIVARKEVGRFSGGILNPRTQANLDSLGLGVPGKFYVGPRQVAYPVKELVKWLRERSKNSSQGGE